MAKYSESDLTWVVSRCYLTYFSADKFWDRAADDLFAYAEHAKRKFTLTEADVDLLMKRYPRISGLFFVLPTKFVSAVINF